MNMQNKKLKLKLICLGDELQTSIKLLQLGLGELQKINMSNEFYHLPFLLLSSGFERLMKCMICFKYLEDKGRFPSLDEIKGRTNGHDLFFLKEKVISDCISKNTVIKRQATKDDYDYISNDSDLNKLIEMLSEFGQYARYYNFDIVTGKQNPAPDVKQRWEQYEFELIKDDNSLLSFLSGNKLDEVYKEINRKIISKLERFARALARQFTLGDLGQEARKYTGTILPFLNLRDDELGQTDYHNL